MAEIGLEVSLTLLGDSSAAKGAMARQGIGKTKHMAVKQLWLQEYVASGAINMEKVPRAMNVSDVLTHGWTMADMKQFHRMNILTENLQAASP